MCWNVHDSHLTNAYLHPNLSLNSQFALSSQPPFVGPTDYLWQGSIVTFCAHWYWFPTLMEVRMLKSMNIIWPILTAQFPCFHITALPKCKMYRKHPLNEKSTLVEEINSSIAEWPRGIGYWEKWGEARQKHLFIWLISTALVKVHNAQTPPVGAHCTASYGSSTQYLVYDSPPALQTRVKPYPSPPRPPLPYREISITGRFPPMAASCSGVLPICRMFSPKQSIQQGANN